MSARIPLNILTEQQKKIIREHLFLQPKKTYFQSNKFGNSDPDPPVLFYWIDKSGNSSQNYESTISQGTNNHYIILPYTFANALFQTHVNSQINYPFSQFSFSGTLRDYQKPLVEQALQQLKEKGTTTLLLGTGAGKSIISAYLASQLGGLTMILTNRESIETGWEKTFQENTNAALWVVESKMKIPECCNVILTMDGKFEKIPWEIRKMVSVLVIDEAHLFATKSQVSVLLGTQPKYVIACTATLNRRDNMERMIQLIAGTHYVEYKIDKRFTVYKVLTGIKTEISVTKLGTPDWAKLVKDLSFDMKRNRMIIDVIKNNPGYKALVLSWSKDHVHLLHNLLKEENIPVDYMCGTKSRYTDSQVLLGTISKISTGFDAKNVADNFSGQDIDLLILAGSTKSETLHIQSLGRALRSNNPIIFDFVDGNRICKSHWNERRKNYENMNCEIKHIEILDDTQIQSQQTISQDDIIKRLEAYKLKRKL